ncbi:hypothetical protein HN011_005978 [Eciton burchellii]|nr:hypothetical protein HN011_005978 [Eciton burchellii]
MEKRNYIFGLTILIVALTVFDSGAALLCYKCNSSDNKDCHDGRNEFKFEVVKCHEDVKETIPNVDASSTAINAQMTQSVCARKIIAIMLVQYRLIWKSWDVSP